MLRSPWGDLRNKGDLSNKKILYRDAKVHPVYNRQAVCMPPASLYPAIGTGIHHASPHRVPSSAPMSVLLLCTVTFLT